MGFHADLTGRENALLARHPERPHAQQVTRAARPIVAFAEVERLSTIRSGPTAPVCSCGWRFPSRCTHDPEILLIDEVLSVSDIAFQREGLDRIAEFKARGARSSSCPMKDRWFRTRATTRCG